MLTVLNSRNYFLETTYRTSDTSVSLAVARAQKHVLMKEGRYRKVLAGQCHLSPWEGDGENLPGKQVMGVICMDLQRGNHA